MAIVMNGPTSGMYSGTYKLRSQEGAARVVAPQSSVMVVCRKRLLVTEEAYATLSVAIPVAMNGVLELPVPEARDSSRSCCALLVAAIDTTARDIIEVTAIRSTQFMPDERRNPAATSGVEELVAKLASQAGVAGEDGFRRRRVDESRRNSPAHRRVVYALAIERRVGCRQLATLGAGDHEATRASIVRSS